MAEKTQKPNDEARDDTQADSTEKNDPQKDSQNKTAGRVVLNYKVVAVLVIMTVIINVAGLAFHSVGTGGKTNADAEHDLGTYHFLANPSEKGQITAAAFNLHIAVIEDIEREARRRLAAKKFRVQQDIEELLRKAHGGDFDDPSLGELKRRLQARVNETLGMKAIADVIITDLKLDEAAPATKPATETTQSLPWVGGNTSG